MKLESPEKITAFINLCSKYDNDINLYDGSVIVDAKSIMGVFSIEEGKVIEVEMLGMDKKEIDDFLCNINVFRAEVE